MTSSTSRRHLIRSLALALAATSSVAGPLALGGAPAEASEVPTGYVDAPAITFVDAQGRQHLITREFTYDGEAHVRLVVARDRADGTPDPSWSPNGRVDLVLVPPATGLEREPVLATTDAGTLSATWIPSGCDAEAGPCDRWFSRHTVSGAPVGAPVLVTGSDDRPVQPLPDGSFLTVAVDRSVGWRGPTGTDRGAPTMSRSQLTSATVDVSGRLLVATSGRRVLRWAPGGPQQVLATVTGCAGDARLVVGRSTTENGFATVCGTGPSGRSPIRVERRAADGHLLWVTTKADPAADLAAPEAALLDDLGRVWVSGQVPGPFVYDFGQVQAFSAAGPGVVAGRWSPDGLGTYGGTDVGELRQAGSHRIAMALDEPCCFTSSGQLPSSTAIGAVLPAPVDLTVAIAPFPTVERFVRRQLVDLVGRADPAAVEADAASLRAGRTSPAAYVTGLLATGRGATTVEPLHRLYRSYFLRDPDIGGLRSYVGQLTAGRRLATIAEEFAGSSEFRNRYGTLSLADFVRTLYRNTFGREGDAAGMDYWYRRLATGRVTKGSMVLQFSESPEGVRLAAPRTRPMAAAFLLLDRRASPDEVSAWGGYPEPRRNAVDAILATGSYVDHVISTGG